MLITHRISVFQFLPISLNVTSGSEAVFRCGHPNATTFAWEVNRTNVNNHPDFRQINTGNTGSLTITARPQYNSTTVNCIAIFEDLTSEISHPAVLVIQGNNISITKYLTKYLTTTLFLTYPGPMDAVVSLTKVDSTLSWEAPFSLDLTNIDPDIVYCVDVYNITCGGRDLVSSDCHVTDTNYTAFSDGYLYEYIVTPRSNVEGAGNGTSRQWRGVCLMSKLIGCSILTISLSDILPTFSTSSTQLSFSTSVSLRNYQIELIYSVSVHVVYKINLLVAM